MMRYGLLSGKRRGISISCFLLFVFIFLKVYRNTTNYTSDVNGGIWNIIVGLFVVFGILYTFSNFGVVKYGPVKVGLVLALVTFINAILKIQTISINSIYYLLICTFYVFVMVLFYNKPLKVDSERQNAVIGIFMLAIQLFLLITFARYFSTYKYYQSGDYLALDSAYYSICLFPFILKYRSKLTIPNFVLLCANAIISSKRAGLIAVVLSIIIFYWVRAKKSRDERKFRTMLTGFAAIALFVLALYFIDRRMNLGFVDRLSNLLKDGGSGRTVIYSAVWNEYASSGLWDQIVGHGLTSIISMKSLIISSAHNDLLNILYESGIVPALLYVSFIISVVIQGIKMRKNNYPYAAVYISSLPICLILTLFSSFFCSASCSIILAAYWGMELRDYDTFLRGVDRCR